MKFSTNWKSSKQRRKQRKYRFNAPLHIRQKFISAHLSKELRKKYKKRSLGLKKGDKVRIMTGKFRKHTGKVERIDLKRCKVFIEGVDRTRKEGTKVNIPIDPSNVMIMELNIDDKKRQEKLNG